jgi:hypothetical protein
MVQIPNLANFSQIKNQWQAELGIDPSQGMFFLRKKFWRPFKKKMSC